MSGKTVGAAGTAVVGGVEGPPFCGLTERNVGTIAGSEGELIVRVPNGGGPDWGPVVRIRSYG